MKLSILLNPTLGLTNSTWLDEDRTRERKGDKVILHKVLLVYKDDLATVADAPGSLTEMLNF